MLYTIVVVPLLAAWLASVAPPGALTLGTRGDRLTVDGEPRFLVLVSYFDALDAAALDEDLAYIARFADGIRILPNWWDWRADRECRFHFSDRTLMAVGAGGVLTLRPARLERLKTVLRTARAAGLVVDVTF